MATGRMLKKNISESRRLAELKTDASRMLWTWIIPYLDVEGRFFASPAIIKGKVVPRLTTFTEKNICKYLLDMERVGLIIIYTHDGDYYLQYRKFSEFQTLQPKKEGKPLPAPPDNSITSHRELHDDSMTTPGELPPNIREVNLREENIRDDGAEAPPTPPVDNSKKEKHLESVFLSKNEYKKLQEAIGQKSLEVGIEKLNYSIAVKGGKYKNHYLCILNWHKRGWLNDSNGGERDGPGINQIPKEYAGENSEISDQQRSENAARARELARKIGSIPIPGVVDR